MEKIEISQSDAFYVRALMARGYAELEQFLSNMERLMVSPGWDEIPAAVRDSVRGACLHAEQLRSEAARVINGLPDGIRFQYNWEPLNDVMNLVPYAGRIVNGEIV